MFCGVFPSGKPFRSWYSSTYSRYLKFFVLPEDASARLGPSGVRSGVGHAFGNASFRGRVLQVQGGHCSTAQPSHLK